MTRYIEGFSHFVTSMTAPIASGWSGWPGGICTHWKAPPWHSARREQLFSGSGGQPVIRAVYREGKRVA